MINKLLKMGMSLLCAAVFLFCAGLSYSGQSGDGPIIHIEQTIHTFSPVFEGEVLSHTVKALNKGTADLQIENVTHA